MTERFNLDSAEASSIELTIDGQTVVLKPYEFQLAFEAAHSKAPTMSADVDAVRAVLGKPSLDAAKAGAVLQVVRDFIVDCREGKRSLFRVPASRGSTDGAQAL